MGEMDTAFRRVAVIVNPSSGHFSARRKAVVRATLEALEQAGVQADPYMIDGPGSGALLAREAIERGCDAVLVCGGDGTVHEVLQALVGTPIALGVIPLGTANALAADLGLARSPGKAVRVLLQARPMPVPVGRIVFRQEDGQERARYFTVAAGVGADALLMARLNPVLKRRLGYVLYVIEAFRIWVSHPFPFFRASFSNGTGKVREEQASQILVVRVRSFGGVLGQLAPGATLHSQHLSLLAFKTRSRYRYLRFLLAVMAGRQTFSRDVELIAADVVECRSAQDSATQIYVEADGEVLGQLPARIEIASQTLQLLIPPDAKP